MARIPVAELRVQSEGPGLVRVTGSQPPAKRRDVRDWAVAAPISAGTMILGGLGVAGLGALMMMLMTASLLTTVVAATMISAGAGFAFLGGLKARGPAEPESKALPPASPATVIAERSRRVRSVLEQGGDHTFERLLGVLRWTEPALLETLVAMKDAGAVIEDLDLETGEWVYRVQYSDYGLTGEGGAMTLADRQARELQAPTETHR